MALSKQQAKTAAKWWADKLRRPKFQTLSAEERSRGDAAGMAEIMTTMLHEDPGKDAAAAFEAALVRRLEGNESVEYRGLHVDYGPDGTLSDALEEAGVRSDLPWKTNMHFRDGSVSVSYGYGAPYEDLPLEEE